MSLSQGEPPGKVRVMYLEDSPADQKLVAASLASEGLFCDFVFARTAREFDNALRGHAFDIILSDFTLPAFTGVEALAVAQKLQPTVPFVLISGTVGEERAVESLRSGAVDYVLKDRLQRLGPVVRRALREAELRRAQRRAEEQLRTSEERFRRLVELSPEAIYIQRENKFVFVNPAALRLFGARRPEDLMGRSVCERMHPDQRDEVGESLAIPQDTRVTLGWVERKCLRLDGSVVDVEMTATPFTFDGQPAAQVLLRDVGDRKQAETELRSSEERLRAVWEESSEGMRLTDRAGRMLSVNEAYCRIVKLPPQRLVGELFTATYHPQGPEEALAEYQQSFDSGILTARRTLPVRLWNSEELEIEISCSFINLTDERRLVLSIFRDVTEQKRAQAQREAFSGLAQRLSAARSAREAAEIAVDVARRLLGWDECSFHQYSSGTDVLHEILSLRRLEGGENEPQGAGGHALPAPLLRSVILYGAQLLERAGPELSPADAGAPPTRSPQAGSTLLVPVRKANAVIGLLSIQSRRPKAYDLRSLETLQALADYCAGALDRIRTHEELQTAQQQLNHFLAESPAVIYSIRIQEGERSPIWISKYIFELLGVDAQEACTPNWWPNHVHPEDLDRVKSSSAMLGRQKQLVCEYRIRHQNGTYRWIRDEQRLVTNSASQPTEILGSWVDISETKSAGEAQKRLATAVEQSADSIIITDTRGTILYVNPAFEKISGYTGREVLGQNPRVLKSDRHDASFYRRMWERLTQGEVWQGRIVNKRKDGLIYEEDATITPVRDAAGRITNYVAVKRDVTREAQLATQLRQSQKMEAIGQLAGGVAHDFNNLLLVMRGNAELLLMDPGELPETAKEGLKQITAAAERAANLTRQLLVFSRKQVMQSQPLSLNEVIVNLTKMLKRIIGENIDLQCHYGAGLPFVEADSGMVEQVLVNLVVNSRDAMPAGGRLHIATESIQINTESAQLNPEARPGPFVCLVVRDNGSGIDPEHLPHIFEPFFTTKEAGRGTGLGLATAYGIVKQHQGWIEVSSQVGVGTTFKIFFPAICAPVAQQESIPAASAPRGGHETILLVEDEPAVRLITRRVLESQGYKVHEASSARVAFETWNRRTSEIALLLTDIVMPEGVSGRELAERLRAFKPSLKVILMSGYSAEVAGKDTAFFRRSSTFFLQKPCASAVLLETVRRCLDGN